MSNDKEKQNGTYIIHNKETSEIYVGSTNDIKRREKEHIKCLKNTTLRNGIAYLSRLYCFLSKEGKTWIHNCTP